MTINPFAGDPIQAQLYWRLAYFGWHQAALGLLFDMFGELEQLDAARKLPKATKAVKRQYARAIENLMEVLQDTDGRDLNAWRKAFRKSPEGWAKPAQDWIKAQYEHRPPKPPWRK